ncbi:hypothetical protein G7Y89_g9884 [Cudoniella acicularis]|uniref:Uncharacterized protein n=1 Tax=Cudoniella acicularis TaxID=354080 RepID=A0A8H4REU1_9HELO|nr:hypothetical protein G7Y89_g9884 [Cudoniella acicularis]
MGSSCQVPDEEGNQVLISNLAKDIFGATKDAENNILQTPKPNNQDINRLLKRCQENDRGLKEIAATPSHIESTVGPLLDNGKQKDNSLKEVTIMITNLESAIKRNKEEVLKLLDGLNQRLDTNLKQIAPKDIKKIKDSLVTISNEIGCDKDSSLVSLIENCVNEKTESNPNSAALLAVPGPESFPMITRDLFPVTQTHQILNDHDPLQLPNCSTPSNASVAKTREPKISTVSRGSRRTLPTISNIMDGSEASEKLASGVEYEAEKRFSRTVVRNNARPGASKAQREEALVTSSTGLERRSSGPIKRQEVTGSISKQVLPYTESSVSDRSDHPSFRGTRRRQTSALQGPPKPLEKTLISTLNVEQGRVESQHVASNSKGKAPNLDLHPGIDKHALGLQPSPARTGSPEPEDSSKHIRCTSASLSESGDIQYREDRQGSQSTDGLSRMEDEDIFDGRGKFTYPSTSMPQKNDEGSDINAAVMGCSQDLGTPNGKRWIKINIGPQIEEAPKGKKDVDKEASFECY